MWWCLLQRCAFLLLPDGEVEPAREVGLPAERARLHHHGDPRAAGGGDRQPQRHGQETHGPKYDTTRVMVLLL